MMDWPAIALPAIRERPLGVQKRGVLRLTNLGRVAIFRAILLTRSTLGMFKHRMLIWLKLLVLWITIVMLYKVGAEVVFWIAHQ